MATRLALLWHMHQPAYTDPVTGEAILPWVRLHATHSYNDMAAMLERHPRVKATVNFVPVLVEQLEQAANGTVKERFLELSRRRVEALSPDEKQLIVRQFFMIDYERGIAPMPRYAELFERRKSTSDFTDDELRDLQVHFNLAWMGFAARAENETVRRLLAKGGGFDEADKLALLDAQQEIVAKVLGRWRALSERGQVELSTTPYFHPILPLLCDSDAARRAMPDATLPPRVTLEDDAREQVALALESHERTFGRRPLGMWPAEGSVSPEALEVFAQQGVRWLATDEGNLFRSQPSPAHPGLLYQAWRCGPIALAFRDRALSDRIGFTYAHMSEHDAVADFRSLVHAAEQRAREAGLPSALVPVVLDGENAWERYPGHGEAFLDALYRALATDVETVTMSEATAHPTGRLDAIHSGSWIDSNYRIWIGHPEDNLAWELLGQVRELVSRHDVPEAKRLVLAAEGSDWFWWYGDDFQTETAVEFDALFRGRLLRAAALVGEEPPARLLAPLWDHIHSEPKVSPPTRRIHPTIDGRLGEPNEWDGAGVYRPSGGQGAMYQADTPVTALLYGSDADELYLRVEPAESWRPTMLVLAVNERSIAISISEAGALEILAPGARGAFHEVIEVSLPLSSFGLGPGDSVRISLVVQRGSAEFERLPRAGELELKLV